MIAITPVQLRFNQSEAAKYLGISLAYFKKLVNEGHIQARQDAPDRDRWYSFDELWRYSVGTPRG